MSIRCFVGAHSARPTNVENRGLHFSSCRGCGRDMIRVDGRWKSVPHGLRIVWKTRRQAQPLLRELPMIVAPAALAPQALPYRRRSSLTQIPALSLSLILWYCVDSFRKWRGAYATFRFERPPPPRLTAR